MNHRKIASLVLLVMLLFSMLPAAFAASDNKCAMGEVYVSGVGCKQPKISVEKKVSAADGTALASSVSGSMEAIRIDNPLVAPGQPVIVDLTIANVGATYPFNLIPLPPNQYAFVLTIDPVDEILYKKEDGTYGRYDMNDVKWGSWFGSDWFAKGAYFIKKAIRDFNAVTSEDLCKYVEVADLFPTFAKQRFIWDNYAKEMEAKHGRISDKNFFEKIDDADIKQYFPAVYEWECIRSVDYESFAEEVSGEGYCGNTVTMGCMGAYMRDNIGKLKTSSFVILTDEVAEGKCEYEPKDGVTYCGVGKDGICPKGSTACQGKDQYTYRFVLLVPADAPALSPQEFEQLVNNGQIQGEFKTNADGSEYNFGFTESAVCPGDDYSAGCHTLNVRVQAVNRQGLSTLLKQGISNAGLGAAAGTFFGGVGIAAGSLFGAAVGLVKGIMVWGNYEIIGAPIYEGQGIFYVVAPALKVTAIFTLYLALFAAAGATLIATGGRRR